MRDLSHLWLLIAAPLLASCPAGPPMQAWEPVDPEPAPTQAQPRTTAADSATAEHMHVRLALVTEMRDAVLYGDAARARSLGARLTNAIEDSDGPPAWEVPLATFAGHARELAASKGLEDVSLAVAALAASCGGCHETLGARPPVSELAAPPPGEDLAAIMRQHQWAADRMWEGLIAPSPDHWLRGTSTFSALPRCQPPQARDVAEDLCTQVQTLARRGHGQAERAGRAEGYGHLLADCARCHRAR